MKRGLRFIHPPSPWFILTRPDAIIIASEYDDEVASGLLSLPANFPLSFPRSLRSLTRAAAHLLLLVALALSASAQETKKGAEKDQAADAGALFEAGQNAHQSGDLAKAIEYYSAALERDPSLWPAEFQRAVAYLSLGRLKEAGASADQVLKLLSEFSDSPELRQMTARAVIVRGEIALAEGDKTAAESAFRRALEINPQAGQAHAGISEIMLSESRLPEAVTEAKAAIAAGDDRSSTWTLLGTALVMNQQYDEAIEPLGEALKRNPRQGAALRTRAEAHIARGRLAEAIRDLRAAVELEPETIVRLRLAEVYAREKQYAEAITLLEAILKAEPDNSEARTQLAAAMIDSGRAAEAISTLETLVKQQPSRADLRAQLAELYLGTDPAKALAEYSAAARLEPAEPRHKLGQATAMVRQRQFKEAVPLLRDVLASNPPDGVAYFAHTNLATSLFEMEDFAGAAGEYLWILRHQQAQGDRRRASISLYFLAICFDKLGDFEQALKAYENFLQLASADNQLEIEKVKLRLPSLKRQIQEGQGRRKKN